MIEMLKTIPWYVFPISLAIASPISTTLSHRFGSSLSFLVPWQIFYSLFLAAVWSLIFFTQKGELQSRTVIYALVVPMIMDAMTISVLNGGSLPLKFAGVLVCAAGLYLLHYPAN